MKFFSLLVCFFVAFNSSITAVSIEKEISNIEKKVDRVDEIMAIDLSKECQKLSNSLLESCQRLEIKKEKLKLIKKEKKNIYNKQKRKVKIMYLRNSIKVKQLQHENNYFLIYELNVEFNNIDKELFMTYQQYVQSKKKYNKTLVLYNQHSNWIERLSLCQKQLFERYKNIRGLKDKIDTYSRDKKISGNEKLPFYGAVEMIDESGLSCLNGNYEIDSVSNFWLFPVENGTISASTWLYPDGGLHLGLDIASAMYSNVYACGNGLILYADACVESNSGFLGNWTGWPNGGGNTICMIVAMSDGLYAVSYNHLSDQIFVSSGQQVKQSDKIALSGNSGNSSGPHTHVEVFRLKQNLQNTVDYFKEGADFSFGCGWKEAATCSEYACRIEPKEVLEGV